MVQVSLEDAAQRLPGLIRNAKPGDEIFLTDKEEPIARIIPIKKRRPKAQFGCAKGQIVLAEDFDTTPEGFEEYMP